MSVLFTDFDVEISPPIYDAVPKTSRWRVTHRATFQLVAEGGAASYADACEKAVLSIFAQMADET